MPANRDKTGRFVKGCSGNPSGRPKLSEDEQDALEAIKGLTMEAVETLRKIMQDENASPMARIKVCEIIFDRAYGKTAAIRIAPKVDFSALDAVDYSAMYEIDYSAID